MTPATIQKAVCPSTKSMAANVTKMVTIDATTTGFAPILSSSEPKANEPRPAAIQSHGALFSTRLSRMPTRIDTTASRPTPLYRTSFDSGVSGIT